MMHFSTDLQLKLLDPVVYSASVYNTTLRARLGTHTHTRLILLYAAVKTHTTNQRQQQYSLRNNQMDRMCF